LRHVCRADGKGRSEEKRREVKVGGKRDEAEA
jgi:hypothetical protein